MTADELEETVSEREIPKSEWQPIETAPDGERVLLARRETGFVLIGTINSERNSVWDGNEFQPLEWFTAWMRLPSASTVDPDRR